MAHGLTARSLSAKELTARSLSAKELTARSLSAKELTARSLNTQREKRPAGSFFMCLLYLISFGSP
jgi:hypothetical protein